MFFGNFVLIRLWSTKIKSCLRLETNFRVLRNVGFQTASYVLIQT